MVANICTKEKMKFKQTHEGSKCDTFRGRVVVKGNTSKDSLQIHMDI